MSKWSKKYFTQSPLYDFMNKEESTSDHITQMLARTMAMFEWHGLPDYIPAEIMEATLMINGWVFFPYEKFDEKIYFFTGGLGGEPDPYYLPTTVAIANPALNISREYNRESDGIFVKNDYLCQGLLPLFRRYATALTENEITLLVTDYNLRGMTLISGTDERTRQELDDYIQGLKDGKISAVMETPFLEGLKTQPLSSSQSSSILTQLIEYEQYLRSGWQNDIGLNSNYNMKRESINSDEAQLNEDMLLPLTDNMMKCRKNAAKSISEAFDMNVSVDFSSAWKIKRQEIQYELKEDRKEGEENGDLSDSGESGTPDSDVSVME